MISGFFFVFDLTKCEVTSNIKLDYLDFIPTASLKVGEVACYFFWMEGDVFPSQALTEPLRSKHLNRCFNRCMILSTFFRPTKLFQWLLKISWKFLKQIDLEIRAFYFQRWELLCVQLWIGRVCMVDPAGWRAMKYRCKVCLQPFPHIVECVHVVHLIEMLVVGLGIS